MTFDRTCGWKHQESTQLEVQRELCSHGLGLTEGSAHPEERLLAPGASRQRKPMAAFRFGSRACGFSELAIKGEHGAKEKMCGRT